jgi:hypothetical protein
MERGLKKAHKTYILARRQILYRMMYETSKRNFLLEPCFACTLHKFSKYLKMPRRLLINSLHVQLNYLLKKKKEQNFILSRLRLFDEQFCLDQIRYLYQVYFDLGSKSYI